MAKLLLAAFCDDVRREMASKTSLMGLFDTFSVPDFTQPLPPFHLFAQIGMEHEGTTGVVMRIQSTPGDFRVEVPGQIDARIFNETQDLYVCNVDYGLVGLRIPRPGKYYVTFSIQCHGEIQGPVFLAKSVAPPVRQ